ncbi:MAG: hypothetical protein IKK34_12935, partial [Clostridia bacterium]|nr:hypothetical protein [Clostridia bacterium]
RDYAGFPGRARPVGAMGEAERGKPQGATEVATMRASRERICLRRRRAALAPAGFFSQLC